MSTKSKNYYKHIDKRIRTYVNANLPIRVRWYEGDYWEHIDKLDGINSKNYNKKQIEVFIEDELPEIIRILKCKNDYSTCVLSPYRYQLELLKDRLEEVHDEEICLTKKLLEEEIYTEKNIAQLTIHKALGRNYDRVYIMPVEDVGQSPRLKNKEIVNVAISLAKKELCVITSAMWMSEKLQEKLLGYTIPHSKESADCYIRELLSYVDERQFHRKAGGKYGFVKSSITSIFDKVPFYRLKNKDINEKRRLWNESGTSAPEYCLFDALRHNDIIKNNYTVFREVPLKAIKGIIPVNNEVRQYIENGARFDFVIANKDNIHAIIEVDGSYHRSNSEMMHKDELKNLAVKSLGKEFAERRFIRFPTDGTTSNEIEEINEIIEKEAESLPVIKKEIIAMKELDNKLIGNRDYLHEKLNSKDEKERKQCKEDVKDAKNSYKTRKAIDYKNDTQVAYYMMKYGKYYALEYYWMYDLALRVLSSQTSSVNQDVAVVYSFGCGSMLDGLSLLYAHNRLLGSSNYHLKDGLYYRGIDKVEWPEQGNLKAILTAFGKDKINIRSFPKTGMDGFWNEMNTFSANILAFPKMLSENLDEGTPSIISQFTEKLQNAKLLKDYIILCISYRGSNSFDKDNPLVEKIVSAMEQNGYNCDPFDKGIYGNWICNDYFVLKDSKKMVFMSKDCSIDYDKTYSDFTTPKEVEDYLTKDILNDSGDDDCKTSPRKNLNSTGGNTCIQVLPFRKK